MAQTMHLALFVPVFVTTAPPIVCFIDYHYIYTINVSWLQKNEERKKKTHLWPKQCQMCCLGLFSLLPPLSLRIP